jgi:hypothetical protein
MSLSLASRAAHDDVPAGVGPGGGEDASHDVERRQVERVDRRRGGGVPRGLGLRGEGERLGLRGVDLVALQAAGDLLVEHPAEGRDDEQTEQHRRRDDPQLKGLPPPSTQVGERIAHCAQAWPAL